MKKQNDKTVIAIYAPQILRDRLELIAKQDNRTLSNQVVQLLGEALENRESVKK